MVNIKNIFLFISIFNFIYTYSSIHSIREIYTMAEAQDILDKADEQTLVLYDVDEVLIVPHDKIHLPKFFMVNPGKALKLAFEQKVGYQLEDIWSIVLHQAVRTLTEPEIVNTIKNLQLRQVKALGLTKMRSGRLGRIPSLAEYRFNQLKNLGIDFHPSYKHTIEFRQFPGPYEGFPLMYKGIILTNELPKGLILGAFIDYLDITPTRVIFFDDNFENVISVSDEMRKRGIEFYGFHYRRAEVIVEELDCAVAQFQLDYLCDHEIWLSEEQARTIMNTETH